MFSSNENGIALLILEEIYNEDIRSALKKYGVEDINPLCLT